MVRTRSQLSHEPITASSTASNLTSASNASLNNRHATSTSPDSTAAQNDPVASSRTSKNTTTPAGLVEIGTEVKVEEREEIQDQDDGSEMLKLGYMLLFGSALSFLIGIWSIAIGPLVKTEGLGVSFIFPSFISHQHELNLDVTLVTTPARE